LDSDKDAITIILFINYLINIIDRGKSPFINEVFITRVFDTDFVPEDRYANILVNEIPKKRMMDIFYLIFERLSEGNGDNLRYFFRAFLNKLNDDEKEVVYREISNFLKYSDDIATIRMILRVFAKIWPKIEESARLRIENKLIKSIKDGKWHTGKEECIGGSFGAWTTNIIENFMLKEKLSWILFNKLRSSDRGEQDYVFRFFGNYFGQVTEKPSAYLKKIVIDGLKKGDIRFKEMVEQDFSWLGDEWQEPFKQDILAFKESPLPFGPEYDDLDVPF
jgi:hypothetical protein